jgi:hypothetical protein
MTSRQAKTARKSRKTLSLSRNAVHYLETYQAQKKEASLSSAVEALIEERKQQDEEEKLAAQTRAYYDSLSSSELHANEAWAKFTESESANSEA